MKDRLHAGVALPLMGPWIDLAIFNSEYLFKKKKSQNSRNRLLEQQPSADHKGKSVDVRAIVNYCPTAMVGGFCFIRGMNLAIANPVTR